MYVRESSSSTVLLVDAEVLVVEDVIWDADTRYCHYYDYGTDILFFILTFDEHSTQVHILFVGGMNLTSLSLSLSATVGFHVPSLAKS